MNFEMHHHIHEMCDVCIIITIHTSFSCSYHAGVMKFPLQANQSNAITPGNMAAFSFYRCILGLKNVEEWIQKENDCIFIGSVMNNIRIVSNTGCKK